MLERIEAALDRIEAAAAVLHDDRDRARARADLLDRAAAETIGALDQLITGTPGTAADAR